jgi:chorismate mutase
MAANWFLDYLDRARMFPGEFHDPLTAEQLKTAAGMPARAPRTPTREKPAAPSMTAPSGPLAPMEIPLPPMPWSTAIERTGEQAAARMASPLIGVAQGLQDLTGLQPPLMDTAQKILADANARDLDYSPSYAQRSVRAAGGTLGQMLPLMGMGGGPLAQALVGAPWFAAGAYPEQRQDLDPMKAAASAALTGGIEMLTPSPVPFLRNTGVAGAVRGAIGETGEEVLEDVKNQLFRGQRPTGGRALDVAREAAGPVGILSLMGLGGRRRPTVPHETQGELPLTGGRGTLAKTVVPKLVAPVATRHHNQTVGSPEGTGSTTDPKTGKRITSGGYAVGVHPELTEQVPGEVITPEIVENFIRRNEETYRKDSGLKFGTWLNTDNNTTYLDAVAIIPDLDTAVQVARNNNEIAIWDLKNKQEIRIDYGMGEQLPFDFGGQRATFAMQTPDWKPYRQPGSGGAGLQSNQPGGHSVKIMPQGGKYVIENFGSKWATAPTLEAARERANQLIAELPTPKGASVAAELAAREKYPVDVEADLGILVNPVTLEPLTQNMPAQPRVVPPSPRPAPAVDLGSTAPEAQLLERAAAQIKLPTGQNYNRPPVDPETVVPTLTAVPGGHKRFGFPVWDFTGRQAFLGNFLDPYMYIAATAEPSEHDYKRTDALSTHTAIRWLKRTDPDYLNLLLSRAVSAYYGDETARAMLQMEEADADARTKGFIEDLNIGLRYDRAPASILEPEQRTLLPLGEVPPLTLAPGLPERSAKDREIRDMDAEMQRREKQESFPQEVMDPRAAAFIAERRAKGEVPTNLWAIYEADNTARHTDFFTRDAAETFLRYAQQKPEPSETQEQARSAFIAPRFTRPYAPQEAAAPTSPGFVYEGPPGGRNITNAAVSEFFDAARHGKIRSDASSRSWKKGNMEVLANPNYVNMLLHGHTIATYDRNTGDLTLTDAGWRTRTTKDRLNAILKAVGHPGIYQHRFKWYVRDPGYGELWHGSLLLRGVVRRDTGTFAHQLPSYAFNLATPEEPSAAPPEQALLPGIGPEVREVKVTGKESPVFRQGKSVLAGSIEHDFRGGALVMGPPNDFMLKGERRAQAPHDLIRSVLDFARDNDVRTIILPYSFKPFNAAFEYEALQRGITPAPMPGGFLALVQNYSPEYQATWGAPGYTHKGGVVPETFGVSEEFFRQNLPKFRFGETESVLWGETENERGELLLQGKAMRPLTAPQTRSVMGLLEGLERMGLPPIFVARLKRIGRGAYDTPNNLAQVDFMNDTMTISEAMLARLSPDESPAPVLTSVIHELGHLASLHVSRDGVPDGPPIRSPLFHLSSPGVLMRYAQLAQRKMGEGGKLSENINIIPPDDVRVGPIMREVLNKGFSGHGLLGELMTYPARAVNLYEDLDHMQGEAFAQAWAAYYLHPEDLRNEMPLSYNMMKELDNYARNSKTFEEWMTKLEAALHVSPEASAKRREIVKKDVLGPYQASFFHSNVAGTDIQQPLATANLDPNQQRFLDRFIRGNEERIFGARRGVQNAEAIDQQAAAYVADMDALAKSLDVPLVDLMKKRGGIAMSAAELKAGQSLMSEAVRQTKQAATAAAQQNADESTVAAFIEQYRGLQELTDEFFRARAEWGRAGQALQRQAIDFADALKLVSKAGGIGNAKDIALMMSTLDESQQAAFARAMKQKTPGQQAWGLWYSFMLSNPKTHIVNLTSNAVYNQWLGLDRLVAAGLGKLHGGDKVYFREMVPTLHGLAQGTLDAIQHSADYLATGGEGGKWDVPGGETQRLGATNLIPRLMGTADAFFRSVAFHQELRRRAMRQAITEGLKGDSLYQREEYLRTHPDEFVEGYRAAERFARKATFTEELGPWTKNLERMRSAPGAPVAAGITRGTVPFLRTIVNLTKQGARHIPGAAFGLPEVRSEWRKGGASRDVAAAEQLTGAGIMALGWLLAEMGKATGAEPPDRTEAAAWRMENQPVSVKAGDQWVGLNRLDPLATVFGIGASMPMIAQSEDQVGAALEAIKQLWFSKTWMTGLSDLFGATESYSPQEGESKLVNLGAGWASTLVPAVMGEAARNVDPYARKQQAEGFEGRVMGRVPGLREQLAPSVNVRGEPIERQQFLGPDFFSPFPTKDATQHDPVLAEMLRVHAVPHTLKGTSKTGKLTPEMASNYQMTSRQIAWPILTTLIYSDEYLDAGADEQKDMIEEVLKKANAQARKELEME